MPTHAEVVDYLTGLDEVEYAEVCQQTTERRHAAFAADNELPDHPTAAQIAEWFARQHLTIEPGLREIRILGDDPVRLLEIYDDFLPAGGALVPHQFVSAAAGPSVALEVAHVGEEDLMNIEIGSVALPPGWTLAGAKVLRRNGNGR